MSFESDLHESFENADGVEGALYAIAIAIEHLAYQVKYLGNGNAASQMGAIEFLGKCIGEKIELLADAVREGD